MNIVIITQDEPFYLAKNLKYLIAQMPAHSKIVGCVVNDVSPFGKKESFYTKAIKTLSIFGLRFFIHYSSKFIKSKLLSINKVSHVLKAENIPLIDLDEHINHPESVRLIESYSPDLLVSILGNQIFKGPIINLAPLGCINLHTALLPKYRGLMPSFWVLKNNEKFTGVSVFYVDEGIDSGPIIAQKTIEIGARTQEELIEFSKKLGMDCIIDAIDLIIKDKVKLIENSDVNKTYYSFPSKSDVVEFYAIGKRFF